MRRSLPTVTTLAFLAIAAACVDPAEVQMKRAQGALEKRAAFDFHCDQDELTITRLDYSTRGVSGCGHQATYVYLEHQGWVMNNTLEHGSAAPE
ncbi:MAG: hypothetical protein ACRENE_05250 [Polyangiaceae bacterium]